ncbi:ScyD/ScyE family protein [Occallatibacter savannae]|uniref:ScyD/ScyE family protein n=1 Tax=Occallatibacter savannae TaxID=1002691 RepID=UPI0013A53259|nr:ScyD/ScyE family protein [Occallatibacter savannae]
MKTLRTFLLTAIVPAIVFSPVSKAQLSSNAHVWVSGLNGPRGLRFGPDGSLYVAEAGAGGTISTQGKCVQVIPPVGPYLGGMTSRISKIDQHGNRTTVASGFPSTTAAVGDLSGVADIAFVDGSLYALTAGAGCSHGGALPNGLYRVNRTNGSYKLVANLSEFLQEHPVRYPNVADFEPDGTFYSMAEFEHRLYAVEPNHGQIISISTDGEMRSVLDVSASEGHIVPTAIVAHDGQLYLGNLNLFPIVPTSSRILTLGNSECSKASSPGLDDDDSPHSLHILNSKAGFTSVTGVAFGPDGLLYVLELSDAPGYPTPGAGKVVRVNRNGAIEDVATGFTVPTAMTFGPDGTLYVSNLGAAPPGAGQIVRVDIH